MLIQIQVHGLNNRDVGAEVDKDGDQVVNVVVLLHVVLDVGNIVWGGDHHGVDVTDKVVHVAKGV